MYRCHLNTVAPAFPSSMAIPLPIPLLAPVTMHTQPFIDPAPSTFIAFIATVGGKDRLLFRCKGVKALDRK